ncbi:SpoIIE family protein phosphatase [Actinacidiphila alni]|uniref:SpoIIE family protein phosphatase n=1 Tax=Actinacidiphila alni TaxID=380248 RepID=UPI001FE60E49|nr:SpoIIE family protein phosphatase [Actinacidiphila alni]
MPRTLVLTTWQSPGSDAPTVESWPPREYWHTDAEVGLCRQVMTAGAPVVLQGRSARTVDSAVVPAPRSKWRAAAAGPEPRRADGLPGAFLGVPVVGGDDEPIGVLGAFDGEHRAWTARNLEDLSDLSAACGAELRLRMYATPASGARPDAQALRHSAELASEVAQPLEALLGRAQLLLRAAEVLTATTGLGEVRRRVSDLVSGDLRPAYVGLSLRDRNTMRRTVDRLAPPVKLETEFPEYALTADWPSAQAARENRVVVVPDRQALIDGYSPRTVAVFDAMGLQTAVCVPLPGTHRANLGSLVLAWDTPHEIDVPEQAVLTAIAGYTARAVERALYFDHQVSTARHLQRAMLTDLPDVPGLDLAALYRPAAHDEMIGGDWYDAYAVTDGPDASHGSDGRDRPEGSEVLDGRRPVVVTVGDITGHSVQAATVMGQARSMLRQAEYDHTGRSPVAAVHALESAGRRLNVDLSGTLVHGHLTPLPDGHWLWEWTNAGHPPPLLLVPGRPVEQLERHDWLLHPYVQPPRARTAHQQVLPPGSTLLLYTDGLVEQPGSPIDVSIEEVGRLLARSRTAGTSLSEVLELLADSVPRTDHRDDIAMLAVHVPPAGDG